MANVKAKIETDQISLKQAQNVEVLNVLVRHREDLLVNACPHVVVIWFCSMVTKGSLQEPARRHFLLMPSTSYRTCGAYGEGGVRDSAEQQFLHPIICIFGGAITFTACANERRWTVR